MWQQNWIATFPKSPRALQSNTFNSDHGLQFLNSIDYCVLSNEATDCDLESKNYGHTHIEIRIYTQPQIVL